MDPDEVLLLPLLVPKLPLLVLVVVVVAGLGLSIENVTWAAMSLRAVIKR